jgi:hypothetical protein
MPGSSGAPIERHIRYTECRSPMSDSGIFWDQLIELLEEGRVVPVVGQDLLTIPENTGHKLLYPFLAERLAKYLRVSSEDLPDGLELNEVACRYIAKGKPSQHIYAAMKTVAAEADMLPVPEPLLQLASMRPIQLFITTTFDSSMTRALSEKRFGGRANSRVLAHAPNEMQDLPADWKSAARPTVYHLTGKLSATPAYALTQEDVLEFFHSLQSETRRPAQLFHELSSRSLLLLGNRFSGWLTSFLMRMSKRQRLSSDDKADYVADTLVSNDENLVLFLERFSSATEIYRDGGAIAFVNELHHRWTKRHPQTSREPKPQSDSAPRSVEPGAVFLSYASGDGPAVERLKNALEEAGVDVFFDSDQLQPGNDWESKLRRSIHQCSLFVPVISRQTLTPDRRFFRVEWNLAMGEAQMASFSSEEVFLLPVVIDDTPIDHPALPARFRAVQWTSLPGGNPTRDFVERVTQLYRQHQLARMGTA